MSIDQQLRLGAFTGEGLQEFEAFLNRLRGGDSAEPPVKLLCDLKYTKEISPPVTVTSGNFRTRLDMARHLYEKLAPVKENDKSVGNRHLWSWLTLFYFDALCPKNETGCRPVRELARYIPDVRFRRYYRHLLAGAYQVYAIHKDVADLLLCSAPHQLSDFYEQLASRQQYITNKGLIQAARTLYFDEERKQPKKGAAPTDRAPGTLRRFIDVIEQLDCTYDLYSMTAEQIIRLLPDEFRTWHDCSH